MSIGEMVLFNWNNWNMWPFLFEESSHQVERPPLTYDLILGRTDRMILFNFRKRKKKKWSKGLNCVPLPPHGQLPRLAPLQ